MTIYRVTVANRDFRSSTDVEVDDQAAALTEGIRGALAIGVDEVCSGQTFFGARVTIERDGECLEHRLVAVGSTPLS